MLARHNLLYIILLLLQTNQSPIIAISGECQIPYQLQQYEQPWLDHKVLPDEEDSSKPVLVVGTRQAVLLGNCTCCCGGHRTKQKHLNPYYRLSSSNPLVVRLEFDEDGHQETTEEEGSSSSNSVQLIVSETWNCTHSGRRCQLLYVPVDCKNDSLVVQLNASGLGRALVTFDFVLLPQIGASATNQSMTLSRGRSYNFDDDCVGSNRGDGLCVSVVMEARPYFAVFDFAAAFVDFLLSLSVGCCCGDLAIGYKTRRSHVKRRPRLIAIACLCQLVLIPMIAIGLGVLLLPRDQVDRAFGLFVTSTLPNPGLAYLITYLTNGDRHLSGALAAVNSLGQLVTVPLWMASVGVHWFARRLQLGKVIGWLLLNSSGLWLGVAARRFNSGLAQGLLTWVTRPCLLMAGILLITLGFYINYYAFGQSEYWLTSSLLALILSGFLVGWLVGTTTCPSPSSRSVSSSSFKVNRGLGTQGQRQPAWWSCASPRHRSGRNARRRCLATNASILNGLLAMPLMRTSLEAPHGDLAAISSMRATILAPMPILLQIVALVFQRWLHNYRRRWPCCCCRSRSKTGQEGQRGNTNQQYPITTTKVQASQSTSQDVVLTASSPVSNAPPEMSSVVKNSGTHIAQQNRDDNSSSSSSMVSSSSSESESTTPSRGGLERAVLAVAALAAAPTMTTACSTVPPVKPLATTTSQVLSLIEGSGGAESNGSLAMSSNGGRRRRRRRSRSSKSRSITVDELVGTSRKRRRHSLTDIDSQSQSSVVAGQDRRHRKPKIPPPQLPSSRNSRKPPPPPASHLSPSVNKLPPHRSTSPMPYTNL